MRGIIIVLLMFGLSAAFTVTPNYIEIQDTGDERLPTLTVDITINCEDKGLMLDVSSADGPLQGAKSYLFYTDYGYHPLPTVGTTDASGRSIMEVPGNLEFLTGLFILRVDHSSYQSREIEFTYEKCFDEASPEPELYEEPEEEPDIEVSESEEMEPEVSETEEPEEMESNVSVNETEASEDITPLTSEEEVPAACPLGFLLLLFLIYKSKS